jgi:hypothetical protein
MRLRSGLRLLVVSSTDEIPVADAANRAVIIPMIEAFGEMKLPKGLRFAW